jgi:hypothetical protein
VVDRGRYLVTINRNFARTPGVSRPARQITGLAMKITGLAMTGVMTSHGLTALPPRVIRW